MHSGPQQQAQHVQQATTTGTACTASHSSRHSMHSMRASMHSRHSTQSQHACQLATELLVLLCLVTPRVCAAQWLSNPENDSNLEARITCQKFLGDAGLCIFTGFLCFLMLSRKHDKAHVRCDLSLGLPSTVNTASKHVEPVCKVEENELGELKNML